jgi:hypothetical protein
MRRKTMTLVVLLIAATATSACSKFLRVRIRNDTGTSVQLCGHVSGTLRQCRDALPGDSLSFIWGEIEVTTPLGSTLYTLPTPVSPVSLVERGSGIVYVSLRPDGLLSALAVSSPHVYAIPQPDGFPVRGTPNPRLERP